MTRNRATWSRRRVTHERAHGNLTACGSVGPTVREPGTATCGRCRALREGTARRWVVRQFDFPVGRQDRRVK